jgi:predicted phage-related endonuclease
MQGHWLELWQIKTGRTESEDLSDNLAVQLGIYTEDFNLEWFQTHQDVLLLEQQVTFEGNINNVPAKGTVDAICLHEHSIVEAKHTNAYNNMDAVIEYYMPQIQLYMRLADCNGAYMSVIFGNNKWESAHVARNDKYFDSMWTVVSDFWGYVVRDEEPVGVDTPTLSIDSIAVDQMVKRDAQKDNHFISRAVDYIENEEAAKAFEAAKKDLKAMVGDNEREVYCDLLTVKRDKRGSLRITMRS